MNYPLITEYLQAIASSEDNLDQLSHLRPVLDDHGEPYRSSGAFAVVFKMQDPESGKCYALKCFTEEQMGRAEAYRQIAEELSAVDSPYITAVQYYDKELFVDSSCTDETEFPVLLMDWVEGVTMEQYIHENHQDTTKMQWLCYRFCRMAAWLRSQALAHGDIKPDNVIVRPDGSLTLVDYDGMFVPAMKGQLSPTLGTRDFSHPERTVEDFDETIDDFALATTALSLKAIALDAEFYASCGGTDRLLFTAEDYRDLSKSQTWVNLQQLMWDKEFATLASQFLAALSQKNLQHLSFRLFNLSKPQAEEPDYIIINEPTPNSNFHIQFKDGNCLYFIYDKDDNSKVWVVAPDEYTDGDRDWWVCSPDWQNYAKPTGKIFIPLKVVKQQVVGIDKSTFFRCNSLQTIAIPDSITEIGDCAFEECSSLQSIVIPDSVTEIGRSAFNGCSSLQTIVIPDSVTKIGDYAFCDCSSLQTIVIPDSVTKIGHKAFAGCSSLQSIVIPDSVTTIDSNAFEGCSSLQSIVIPKSIREIGRETYLRCSNLQHIVIPDSVIKIESEVFLECTSLQSIIVESNNPKYDSRNNCNAIIETASNILVAGCKNTVIPDSVTVIDQYAFFGFSSLQSIVIPGSVSEIGEGAFGNCSSLQSIFIPDSVTKIGDWAFSCCSSLQSIVVDRNNTEYDSRNNCNAIIETASNILVAGCNNTVIPNSVMVIGETAFSDCSSLQTIVIPDSVTEIGWYAFFNCSSLQSIVIPDSVTEIGEYAFDGCSSLQSIKINNSQLLEGLGLDLSRIKILPNDEGQKYVIINEPTPNSDFHIQFKDGNCLYFKYDKEDPSKVWVVAPDEYESRPVWQVHSEPTGKIGIPQTIGNHQVVGFHEYAFDGCSGLRSISIPDSVTDIGYCSFANCSNLHVIIVDRNSQKYDSRNNCNAIIKSSDNKLIVGCTNTVIPDSVTEIGYAAFRDCISLQSIVIPNSVTKIGADAFCGCNSLQSIIIPDSVTEIGADAFCGCNSLQSIVISDSVIEIRGGAFSGCIRLQAIVIPDSVSKIGEWTFSGCNSLQSIVIPNSVTKIGNYTFMGCICLQTIAIPDSVSEIGVYAFSDCSSLQSIVVERNNPRFDSRNNCNAIIETTSNKLIVGCQNTVIPNSVTEIGESAFFGCSSLQTIVIPDSVSEIGDNVFWDCISLQSIVIPDSVTGIGRSAFYGCSSLKSIKIKNPKLLEGTGVDLNKVKIITD